MDRERFQALCREALAGERRREGIGTLGEKTLHAVLKAYFAGPGDGLEVPVGPFVADVQGPEGVVEIQTGNFRRLREKLPLFLSLGPVTVVYPVPAKKWLVWLEEDGTLTPRRKSPKVAGPWQVLPELYDIRDLLLSPGLRLCVALLELEEYRLKNGWGNGGKRGSTRQERLPLDLLEEVWVRSPKEWGRLLPRELPREFTAKDFSKLTKLSPKKTYFALGTLQAVGAVVRLGKRGNAYVYERAPATGEKED